jgi:hypothetical protein
MMMRRFAPAAFAACLLGIATPGGAQDAAAVIDDVVALCPAALRSPVDGISGAVLRGYSAPMNARLNAVAEAWGAGGSRGSLSIIQVTFSDEQTTVCQLTATIPLTVDDAKALKAALEKVDGLGEFEGDAGSPAMGTQSTMQAHYKRKGPGPKLGVTVFSIRDFATVTVSTTVPRPAP